MGLAAPVVLSLSLPGQVLLAVEQLLRSLRVAHLLTMLQAAPSQ